MTNTIPAILILLALASPVEQTIIFSAMAYDVDPTYILCIAQAESEMKVTALGKAGEHGLFQWMPKSWQIVRGRMGLDTDFSLTWDARENARAAGYAMGVMGLDRWWTTAEGCQCNGAMQ